MKLTVKEYGALEILLSCVDLTQLIEAARKGFEIESKNAISSDEKELAILCDSLLASLK